MKTQFFLLNEVYPCFSGHLRRVGKGVGVKKIGTYPFTSPVRNIVLEPSLLHALTDTGTYLVKFRNPV